MADFGANGKITTKTKNVGGATVDLSNGEHVCYKLTVLGGPPVFNLTCNNQPIWSEKDFGAQMDYEIEWPRNAGDVVSNDARYILTMAFFNDGTYKLKYSLRMEHHDRSHNVKEVLTDHDYESDDPGDAFGEGIRIATT